MDAAVRVIFIIIGIYFIFIIYFLFLFLFVIICEGWHRWMQVDDVINLVCLVMMDDN